MALPLRFLHASFGHFCLVNGIHHFRFGFLFIASSFI